jgi:hypothetical protein
VSIAAENKGKGKSTGVSRITALGNLVDRDALPPLFLSGVTAYALRPSDKSRETIQRKLKGGGVFFEFPIRPLL